MSKLNKENSFLRVRNLLADEVIINLHLQKAYDFLGIPYEGSHLEMESQRMWNRWQNDKHLNKIQRT